MKKNNIVAGYRVRLGKTQKDMATILKISPQAYNAKENGRRSFTDLEKRTIKEMFCRQVSSVTYEELFFL